MNILRLFKGELSSAAASWVRDGIISEAQAGEILARYGTTLPDISHKSIGYYILTGLAALFMGLGAIVLISHNWDEIPRAIRMISLIGLTLGINLYALNRLKAGNIHAARVGFVLGAMLYGASIMLIAQIYHLGEHYPDGIYFWIIGILPIALLADSLMIMLIAAMLSGLWLMLEADFGNVPLSFAVFLALGAWYCFFMRRSLLLFLLVVVGVLSYVEVYIAVGLGIHFKFFGLHTFFLGGIFVLLYWAGWALERLSANHDHIDYGIVLRLWSIRFGIIWLLIFSFRGPWHSLYYHVRTAQELAWSITLIMLLLLALAIIWSVRAGRMRAMSMREVLYENASSIVFSFYYLLCAVIVLLNAHLLGSQSGVPDGSTYWSDGQTFKSAGLWLQIMSNLVLLVVGIRLILGAYKTGSSSYFYLGVITLLALALLRYLDLIGDYISGAIVFFVAGMILFAAARTWRKHLAQSKAVTS